MPRHKVYDDDLRRRLVTRAAEMLVEGGPGALTVRAVAAAEDTSTTAIYSMFDDRAGLIREVGRTAGLGFVAAQHEVPMTTDPYVDMLNLGRAYRAWALANPTLYLVLMAPSADAYLEGPLPEAPAAKPLRDILNRLISAEVFLPLDLDMVLGITWAAVHGFVSLEIAGYFAPTPQEQLDVMYEAQLEAIGRSWRR